MPKYRNDGSMALNYSDSGGPEVAPGAEFEHDIPPAQLESHLRSGFISVVAEDSDVHEHSSTELLDRLRAAPSARSQPLTLNDE
jgi:hypothetical protein